MPGLQRNKLLGWLLLALAIYYVATDPTGAGHTGKALIHGAQSAAHALITFTTDLSH